MRIKFVRVDEIDRKKLALNLAKKARNRKESGARAGDLLARMGTHQFNPEGASTGPLKEPIQGGRKSKAQRLAKRASFFRKKGLSTPGQADPGTAQDRERALAAGEERGRNRRGMNRAMRLSKQNASTEILGNKIVEGFNSILEKFSAKNVAAAAIGQARRGGGSVEKGYLPKTKFITVKRPKGDTHVLAGEGGEGGTYVSKKTRSGRTRIRSIPDSTEILGNKIVEGFNQFLDRMDELSRELKARAAKAAKKKAKEHAKIASAAGKVKARDTEVIHDKISRSKKAQADRFEGKAGGEDKVGKRAYHQAKKEAGIGTRIIPVRKR